MGRLFWKFFFAFLAALLLAGLAVGVMLSLLHPQSAFNERVERWTSGRIAATAQLMSLLDRAQLHTLWAQWHTAGEFVPLAVDGKGIEVLGRAYRAEWMAGGREVTLADGQRLRVFVDPQSAPGFRPPPPGIQNGSVPPGEARRLPPPEPGFRLPPPLRLELLVGLLAALGFGAMLAWYLSKPVRHLQQAFDALGGGRLETRVGERMDGRRDEIADLGRRFDAMADRLEQSMGAQKRLLHDVSHELRSPLARLSAAIGLARQDPTRLETMLERIERESTRLDQLVGELLTLSRLEAGAPAAEPAEFEVGELLGELVDDAGFEGRSQACTVKLNCAPGLRLQGQPELLYRALDNVLRNAVRHSPPGGWVHVTAAMDPSGAALRLAVEDQGEGVPEAALATIFEPFQRGGSAREGRGFGLGLAIARRAIEAHGGSIFARNLAGGGLRMDIILPLAEGSTRQLLPSLLRIAGAS